jgi:hypothetical protein
MHYVTRRLSPSLIVALMALFLALAGTAAANSVLSSNGAHSKSKAAAGDAQRSLKAAAGCVTGNVLGFARVKGKGSIPKNYTNDKALIDFPFNCTGIDVFVRRERAGVYFVRFPNNPAALALVTSNEDGATTDLGGDTDNVVTVGKVPSSSPSDAGAFRVDVLDIDAHQSQDAPFTIMTP